MQQRLSLSLVSQQKHNGQHGTKTKFQEYSLTGKSINENSGQLTVSEVQLSSSSPFKRAVYSLLVRQPDKSFDTEQVRKKLYIETFFHKHLYLVNYDLTCLSKFKELLLTGLIYSY